GRELAIARALQADGDRPERCDACTARGCAGGAAAGVDGALGGWGRGAGGRSRGRAEACEAAKTTEKAAARIESRRGNMHASERTAVSDFDGDEVFIGGGLGDVERQVALEF
ncbi:MAG: hypothetical protein ACK56I_22090, partial [bacterium]